MIQYVDPIYGQRDNWCHSSIRVLEEGYISDAASTVVADKAQLTNLFQDEAAE